MIAYELDQARFDASEDARFDLALEGETDGAWGLPINPSYSKNLTYLNAYIRGLGQWTAQLENEQSERYELASLEF